MVIHTLSLQPDLQPVVFKEQQAAVIHIATRLMLLYLVQVKRAVLRTQAA